MTKENSRANSDNKSAKKSSVERDVERDVEREVERESTVTQPDTDLYARINELTEQNRRLEEKVAEEIRKNRQQDRLVMEQTKLAAMGQMVSAIAHHWRQPLTVVTFIIQNIKVAYQLERLSDEYLEDAVARAMEQIQRMSKTIDNLQSFLKYAKDKEDFVIETAVIDTLSILSAKLRDNAIQVHFTESHHGAVKINGFPNDFKQVVINIVDNAIHAILKKTDKGLMEMGEGVIGITILRRGERVFITITNNGEPISDSGLTRIFEPFYTTMENGRGMGVGLYMSKMIIEQNMGGKLYARNNKNGVVFILQLDTVRELSLYES